jgi:hypothetical protein
MKKIRGESISAASVNLLNTTRPKITFNLTCLADDSICNGAYNTFEKAADIITKVFSLKSNIAINASFISFCKVMGDCIDNNEMITAGQATPTISYIMSDLSDNTTRMYPQALLKQFTRLSTTPQWDEYDITASFNTEMDWHFIVSERHQFYKNFFLKKKKKKN